MSEKIEPEPLVALKSPKGKALTYYHRSKVYTQIDWFGKGRQYARKALALDENKEDFYFQLGKVLYRETKYIEATEAILKGLNIKKASTGIQMQADILHSSGKYYQALTILEQNKDLLSNYEWLYSDILYHKCPVVNRTISIAYMIRSLQFCIHCS